MVKKLWILNGKIVEFDADELEQEIDMYEEPESFYLDTPIWDRGDPGWGSMRGFAKLDPNASEDQILA